jgi:hypothetical protein
MARDSKPDGLGSPVDFEWHLCVALPDRSVESAPVRRPAAHRLLGRPASEHCRVRHVDGSELGWYCVHAMYIRYV